MRRWEQKIRMYEMYMTIYITSVFLLILFWIPYFSVVLWDFHPSRLLRSSLSAHRLYNSSLGTHPLWARAPGWRQWKAFVLTSAGSQGPHMQSYLLSQKRAHKTVNMEPWCPHMAQTSGSSLSRRLSYATCDLRVSMPRPLAEVFLVTFSQMGPFFPPPRFMQRANPASPVPSPWCRDENAIHRAVTWEQPMGDVLDWGHLTGAPHWGSKLPLCIHPLSFLLNSM